MIVHVTVRVDNHCTLIMTVFVFLQNKFKREEKKSPQLIAQALSKLLKVTLCQGGIYSGKATHLDPCSSNVRECKLCTQSVMLCLCYTCLCRQVPVTACWCIPAFLITAIVEGCLYTRTMQFVCVYCVLCVCTVCTVCVCVLCVLCVYCVCVCTVCVCV